MFFITNRNILTHIFPKMPVEAYYLKQINMLCYVIIIIIVVVVVAVVVVVVVVTNRQTIGILMANRALA